MAPRIEIRKYDRQTSAVSAGAPLDCSNGSNIRLSRRLGGHTHSPAKVAGSSVHRLPRRQNALSQSTSRRIKPATTGEPLGSQTQTLAINGASLRSALPTEPSQGHNRTRRYTGASSGKLRSMPDACEDLKQLPTYLPCNTASQRRRQDP